MSKQFQKEYIVVPVLFIIVIISLVVWFMLRRNPPTPVADSRTPAVYHQLADICDCVIVTERGIISPKTKEVTERFSDPATLVPDNIFYGQWMSSSRTMELAVDAAQSSIFSARYPSGHVRTLYSAPSGEAINGLVWSPDETNVVIGVASVVEGTPPGERMPTQIFKVDVLSGVVSVVMSKSDFDRNHLSGATPVAVNNDGTRMVLHTGTNIGDIVYWSFDKKTGVIGKLDPQPMAGIYFSHSYSGEEEKLLWVDAGNKLHSYSVDDGSYRRYDGQAWSDAPFSRPSPDGKKILYLRGEQSGEYGIPALLDLETGASRDLTKHKMGLPGGLARSFWSPDSTWVFFQNPDVSEQAYQAFRVSSTGIEEKLVYFGFVVDIGHTSISALVNANSD